MKKEYIFNLLDKIYKHAFRYYEDVEIFPECLSPKRRKTRKQINRDVIIPII